VLDVPVTATQATIRESYKILASIWHPDRFRPTSKQHLVAAEKMREINAAYEVLRDPKRRKDYDRTLQRREKEQGEARYPLQGTPEQGRKIEQDRQRYRQALDYLVLRKFCEAVGFGRPRLRRTLLEDLVKQQIASESEEEGTLKTYNLPRAEYNFASNSSGGVRVSRNSYFTVLIGCARWPTR